MMRHTYTTTDMVEQLVTISATSGLGSDTELLRRTLHALISLAKSEQLLQMRLDVASAMGLNQRQEW